MANLLPAQRRRKSERNFQRHDSPPALLSGQHSYMQTIYSKFAARALDQLCWEEKLKIKRSTFYFRKKMSN